MRSLKLFRFRWILSMLLVWSQWPCSAIDMYESFKMPLQKEMTRLQVQEVLGDPKFIFYRNFYLPGFVSFMEVCVAGYRVTNKEHGLAEFVTIVFTHDVQLAITVLYNENKQKRFLKQIVENPEIVSIPLDSRQGYFDEKDRLMYFFNNDSLSGLSHYKSDNAYQRFVASLGRFTTENMVQILGLGNMQERPLNTVEDKIITMTSVDLYATSAMALGRNPHETRKNR